MYRSRNLSIENARHDIKTPTAAIIQEAKEMGLISNGSTGPTGTIGLQDSERIFSVNNAPIEPPTDPIQTPVLIYNTKIVAFNGDWYLVYNDDPL